MKNYWLNRIEKREEKKDQEDIEYFKKALQKLAQYPSNVKWQPVTSTKTTAFAVGDVVEKDGTNMTVGAVDDDGFVKCQWFVDCELNEAVFREEDLKKVKPLAQWDFQTALGDTIRDKYKGEYVSVVEIKQGPGDLYFYCPKVPSPEEKPVALDPDTFIPRKGILTRYGKKLLEEGAKYYGKVNINEL
jgi:uncharacterized protein YodC (DUF2158 family)